MVAQSLCVYLLTWCTYTAHTKDMNTATAAIARKNTATKERELRATVAALPASYLAMLGLGTPEAVEAYIAAEMAD